MVLLGGKGAWITILSFSLGLRRLRTVAVERARVCLVLSWAVRVEENGGRGQGWRQRGRQGGNNAAVL